MRMLEMLSPVNVCSIRFNVMGNELICVDLIQENV